MLHAHRGWIFLLLFLAGFFLPATEVILFGSESIAFIQARNPEKAALVWLMVGVAPFFSYLLFRFLLVSAKNAAFFQRAAQVVICVALGLVASHSVTYARVDSLAVGISQVLAGIGALQACRYANHPDDRPVRRDSVFWKLRARAQWFIGTRYFVALVAVASCVAAVIWLRTEDCGLSVIILGMGAALALGVFSGGVAAWLVAKLGGDK